ncbi:hypothetical protein JS533_009065 [Bifidobacterium amazonense]|uniref:Uncharacterized protein n=1 Tax=Bifidobacterium amazonense TaxID=2809027 RepID=A0ABS9VWF0_9BIFI|nr:hypothetical protein [Bifidobacterium amazonense]MCH9276414.1 hypothetical protein [Bifidobacterium amazonense]
MSASEQNTDPTRLADTGTLTMPPRWAGDVDVYAPGKDDDWQRVVRMTGGVGVADDPSRLTATVLLDVNCYEQADGSTEAFAGLSLDINEKTALPVALGSRTAAAYALMQAAFEQNAPEPDTNMVDELEALIGRAAERLTAAHANTTIQADKEA